MPTRIFVHYNKYASPSEWITVSGIHRHFSGIMPIISKKDGTGTVSRVCLHSGSGRRITMLKLPMSLDMKFHARVKDMIDAMRRTGDVIICNHKDQHGRPASPAMPDIVETSPEGESSKIFSAKEESLIPGIYINISEYKKEQNSLSFLAKGVVDFSPVSSIKIVNASIAAARAVAIGGIKAHGIYKYLNKSKKVNLTIADVPTGDVSIKIKRKSITFAEVADILDSLHDSSLDRSTSSAISLARHHVRPLLDVVVVAARDSLIHAFR